MNPLGHRLPIARVMMMAPSLPWRPVMAACRAGKGRRSRGAGRPTSTPLPFFSRYRTSTNTSWRYQLTNLLQLADNWKHCEEKTVRRIRIRESSCSGQRQGKYLGRNYLGRAAMQIESAGCTPQDFCICGAKCSTMAPLDSNHNRTNWKNVFIWCIEHAS